MLFNFKYFHILIVTLAFFILNACKLQEPTNNHGILFLKNRAEKLTLNESNTNDVIRIMGSPHTRSIKNENEWIYLERVLTKGEFLRLGQNVIKENNVLVLNFNKYGILKDKQLYDLNSKNELKFSKDETSNELSQKSFVEKFLESLKKKMYKTN